MITIDDRIQASRDAATNEYERVRSNPDTTREAKQRDLAKAWVRHADEMAKLQGDETAATKTETDKLMRDLYGIPAGGDAASYRDALEAARDIDLFKGNGPEQLAALLEQARVTGDTLLTRAVLKVAFDGRIDTVIEAHMVENPRLADDCRRLWELTAAQSAIAPLAQLFQFLAAKPVELSSIPDDRVRLIAAGATVR